MDQNKVKAAVAEVAAKYFAEDQAGRIVNHACVVIFKNDDTVSPCKVCGKPFYGTPPVPPSPDYDAAMAVMELQAIEIERLKNLCKLKDIIINAGNGHYQKMMEYHEKNIELHGEISNMQKRIDMLLPPEMTAEQRAAKIADCVRAFKDQEGSFAFQNFTGDISDFQMGETNFRPRRLSDIKPPEDHLELRISERGKMLLDGLCRQACDLCGYQISCKKNNEGPGVRCLKNNLKALKGALKKC